ncbi:ATP--guanido phosphotransferase [[Clostridium] colinum]|uniref:ATP--guanido phosphotransferase n=1 Tax=[Clostridium] colinum TaxID=36835 RepID=UPI002024AFD0|nr:ATP--guanido phosphotransferase [[Clostridium] colinum]
MFWYEEKIDDNIIISSRVRLARNLKDYPFYYAINEEQSKEMIENINRAIFNDRLSTKNYFEKIDFDNLDKVKQYTMLEKYIVSNNFLESNKPKAIILEKNKNINIMINEEDHIRIQAINSGYNIEKCFEEANRIDNLLEETLSYAFDKQYGYLTSCITNLGTGLRGSFMLHIPMLEKYGYIQSIAQNIAKFGMTLRGMHGEGSKAFGAIYQISNQITLGKTEKQILKDLQNITLQIVERENSLRESLKSDKNINIEDKISRSYGIIKYCKQIKFEEAMEHLSNIWLGLDIGIIDNNLCDVNIYNVMMNIQSANIIDRYKINEKEDIKIYRAKYLNEVFNK